MQTSATSSHSPWPARLISEVDAADRRVIPLARGLTAEQLNWRPSAASWSIGQCLDHLRVGNETYLTPLAAALDGKRVAPVQDITPGWFGRWFIRNYLEPSPETKRAKAPKKIVPAQHVETGVVEQFLHSNQRLRELIQRASMYDVNRIRFKNPFIPVLGFTVGTGFLILTAHQRRHLLQAERVKQAQGFPI
jgi:hypothetical protein